MTDDLTQVVNGMDLESKPWLNTAGYQPRDANGKLLPGAKLVGGGNPEARAQYEARQLWRNAASEEEQLAVRAQLVERCMAGNMGAIRLYVDIMHGKQAIPIELSGPDGESIKTEAADTLAVVLGALQAFPEARIKVAAALAGRPAQTEGSVHGSADSDGDPA